MTLDVATGRLLEQEWRRPDMTTVTYPNGQSLTSTAITQSAMQILMQNVTCGALGIVPPDFSQVKIDWPQEGQPFTPLPSIAGCFLACSTKDEAYSKVRDQVFSGTGPVTETWTYTRGWHIAWTLYGPNCVDRARQIHSATFLDWFNDLLSVTGLYPLNDPPNPTYIPETWNAQWWPRSDFYIDLYEAVTETIQDSVVKSVEIKVNADDLGQVVDFTVS